jgi:hypothetical protein
MTDLATLHRGMSSSIKQLDDEIAVIQKGRAKLGKRAAA